MFWDFGQPRSILYPEKSILYPQKSFLYPKKSFLSPKKKFSVSPKKFSVSQNKFFVSHKKFFVSHKKFFVSQKKDFVSPKKFFVSHNEHHLRGTLYPKKSTLYPKKSGTLVGTRIHPEQLGRRLWISQTTSSQRFWKVSMVHFPSLGKTLGLRPNDQSCHHETWLHLPFVDWNNKWSNQAYHNGNIHFKERPAGSSFGTRKRNISNVMSDHSLSS